MSKKVNGQRPKIVQETAFQKKSRLFYGRLSEIMLSAWQVNIYFRRFPAQTVAEHHFEIIGGHPFYKVGQTVDPAATSIAHAA